jgi:hypothetical protein
MLTCDAPVDVSAGTSGPAPVVSVMSRFAASYASFFS